ncbi:HAD family hydrolase [Anthocerotibacter panamensis]|uniref:HAD family hydrolase n=1 Tax=Anthocerotibacter panamensis TaxID=2857077 RepID=UPI001C407DC4|nr:HAD family hydrolase [Anthocerotibacter panamensis]
MPFAPLNTLIARDIRLVATDMDGTLTEAGRFSPQLLQALIALADMGVPVLIVTGRSAGWVQGLTSYLPVAGALAENGGLGYLWGKHSVEQIPLTAPGKEHRPALAQMFAQLQTEFPDLQESSDNCFRLTDWTFDNPGFSQDRLSALEERCRVGGWSFTYSSVQCHIKPVGQDKATGLLQVLRTYFLHLPPEAVLTVGDSPNDAPLFDPAHFPNSVGVANVAHYAGVLPHPPAYITTHSEGQGFCELVDWLGAGY